MEINIRAEELRKQIEDQERKRENQFNELIIQFEDRFNPIGMI